MTDERRDAVMVVHKATRDCPMLQPHPRESCGIVKARERKQGVR